MVSLEEATRIAYLNSPWGVIKKRIVYNDNYIFMIVTNDVVNGDMDPFYSVNKDTGEFSDFSIITDGDITEILELFERTPNLI